MFRSVSFLATVLLLGSLEICCAAAYTGSGKVGDPFPETTGRSSCSKLSRPSVSAASSYQYSGDGTYYGAGADSGSYCRGNGFPYGSGSGLPTVAVSQTILQNGANCGSCIILVGDGGGSGTTPISSTPTMYVINNLCSECGTGADLALNGDGRFPVSFNIVPCPSGKRRMSSRRLLESEDVS
ncbi:hypothetical protein WJX84_007254 [Apatococcus fuscideae]|uniref:Expansin-like EG45 domain-containing protein n=1 Tax=Apatococcus fuscideae TaxID=2026836 RepID=A0AAW1SW91_9CHLO